MEKILLIVNARTPNLESISFACKMAKTAQTKLTGLFIENLNFDYVPPAGIDTPSYFIPINQTDTATIAADTERAIKLFLEQCEKKGVQAEIYRDKGEPLAEVLFESRFADLLIVTADNSYYPSEEQMPSNFVKKILANAECPVLLAPQKIEEFDEIVFCYDGSVSSVFAIKQFTYLLPEFNNKKVLLLEVNKSQQTGVNESLRRMMQWLRAHYSTVAHHSLTGNVKDELFTYFFMKTNKLIVIGAYGRSMLSSFFKKSSADVLIHMVDLPLFITHH